MAIKLFFLHLLQQIIAWLCCFFPLQICSLVKHLFIYSKSLLFCEEPFSHRKIEIIEINRPNERKKVDEKHEMSTKHFICDDPYQSNCPSHCTIKDSLGNNPFTICESISQDVGTPNSVKKTKKQNKTNKLRETQSR